MLMRKEFIAISIMLLVIANANAQQKGKRFYSVNQVGVLKGQSGNDMQFQTVNGVNLKGVMVGVGLGLEYYQERSVPLFLDIRKNLGQKNNNAFVYLNGGYNLDWMKKESIFQYDSKGGPYFDGGLGYQFPLSKRVKGVISLGYSIKTYSEVWNAEPWSSRWPAHFEQLDYTLRRVGFRFGVGL
jgi:hypothetical protein